MNPTQAQIDAVRKLFPALPPELDARWPCAVMCYLIMLPGATREDREKVVLETTTELEKVEKAYGGHGLVCVWMDERDGRLSWLVDPIRKDGLEAMRMARVAQVLRQWENQQWNL